MRNYEIRGAATFRGKVIGQTISGAIKTMPATSPATVNFDDGNLFILVVTGNYTINASNGTVCQDATFRITNTLAATASTIYFNTGFKPDGELSIAAAKSAMVTFQFDGTSWWEKSRKTGL